MVTEVVGDSLFFMNMITSAPVLAKQKDCKTEGKKKVGEQQQKTDNKKNKAALSGQNSKE